MICCVILCCVFFFFFVKQKTAYEMRISDWSSDVCSSDLGDLKRRLAVAADGGVSAEELQHARDRVAQLEAQLATTQEELATNNAQIENTTIADHPQVLAAAAREIGRAHV